MGEAASLRLRTTGSFERTNIYSKKQIERVSLVTGCLPPVQPPQFSLSEAGPDASAARYPSQTSTIPYHTIPYPFFFLPRQESFADNLLRVQLADDHGKESALLDKKGNTQCSSFCTRCSKKKTFQSISDGVLVWSESRWSL